MDEILGRLYIKDKWEKEDETWCLATIERLRKINEKYEKGAKKIKKGVEDRFLQHSIFCNYQTFDNDFCNCGLTDVVRALEMQKALEGE